MADSTKVKEQGYVSFTLRCGDYYNQMIDRISPNMHQELILAISWMRAENPQIDWRQGRIQVVHKGQPIYLPCYHQSNDDNEDSRCQSVMCNAKKTFIHEMRAQRKAYLGILRAVSLDKLEGSFRKKHPSDVDKIKRDDLSDEIWKICQKYVAVFPKDLPKGVIPKLMGNEFKIVLEPETAQSFGQYTSLASSSWKKAKTQITSMLKHRFIRPSQSP